jgi:hypothetical protein
MSSKAKAKDFFFNLLTNISIARTHALLGTGSSTSTSMKIMRRARECRKGPPKACKFSLTELAGGSKTTWAYYFLLRSVITVQSVYYFIRLKIGISLLLGYGCSIYVDAFYLEIQQYYLNKVKTSIFRWGKYIRKENSRRVCAVRTHITYRTDVAANICDSCQRLEDEYQ